MTWNELERKCNRLVKLTVSSTYDLVFGALDRKLAHNADRRLENEIREHVSFLFTEYAGIVADPPESRYDMGGLAMVIIIAGPVAIRFCRGRGDLTVALDDSSLQEKWMDAEVVLAALQERDERLRPFSELGEVSALLQPHMPRLQRYFAHEPDPSLSQRIADLLARDRILIKQAEWVINNSIRKIQ